jgi:hypothetical protein
MLNASVLLCPARNVATRGKSIVEGSLQEPNPEAWKLLIDKISVVHATMWLRI